MLKQSLQHLQQSSASREEVSMRLDTNQAIGRAMFGTFFVIVSFPVCLHCLGMRLFTDLISELVCSEIICILAFIFRTSSASWR